MPLHSVRKLTRFTIIVLISANCIVSVQRDALAQGALQTKFTVNDPRSLSEID